MAEPLSPDQVIAHREKHLPDAVVDAFNDLIAKHWDGRSARVTQDEAIQEIQLRLGISRQAVFRAKLLDVEQVYRSKGWEVEFDKPGYCETYGAFFVFRKSIGYETIG